MKMQLIVAAMVIAATFAGKAEARRFRKSSGNYYYTSSPVDNATAQGVANTMASRGYVSHFGGHPGMYEGCGSGWTQDQAFRNCCYSNSGMPTVDVGYAQGKSGMWYCCRRYRR